MKTLLLDANIIVRYLVRDTPHQSAKAKTIIQTKQYYTDPTIIAEVIWVLQSFYKLNKTDIIPNLTTIINQRTNKSPYKKLIINTLELYATHNLSYIDCWLYSVGKKKSLPLATFDAKLARL